MRIFITGATGFVGSHIFAELNSAENELLYLKDSADTSSFDDQGAKELVAGLSEIDKIKRALKDFDPEICVHCAWQGIPDYSEKVSKLNLNNSVSLIDFLTKETNCKKIMVTGSCFEYGTAQGICAEDKPTKINSFFAWAKQSLYGYASHSCQKKGVDLVWFRIFYVYGPKQRKGSLVPTVIDSFQKKQLPDIRNPFNANDYVFVEDVAKAFGLASKKDIPSGIYNLGRGESNKVIEICEIAENKILGNDRMTKELNDSSQAQQSTNFWADSSKTQNYLGWQAGTTLEQGIEKYIRSLGVKQ